MRGAPDHVGGRSSVLRAVGVALLGGALLSLGSVAAAGEALPVGPPWKTSWTQAKRAALETGRPIFAYFTKHY